MFSERVAGRGRNTPFFKGGQKAVNYIQTRCTDDELAKMRAIAHSRGATIGTALREIIDEEWTRLAARMEVA